MLDIHKNPIARALPYTWAGLPAVGTPGRLAWCTNFGTKGALLIDDGTRWKPNGRATLASLDATVGPIANTETNALQYQFSTAMWALKDHLHLYITMTKSGATDSGQLIIRVGTAGTSGDTLVLSANLMAAANRVISSHQDYRLDDATHILQLGANTAANSGYSNAGNSAMGASVAVSSAIANSLFFTVALKSSSTNDTVNMIDAVLQYVPSGN